MGASIDLPPLSKKGLALGKYLYNKFVKEKQIPHHHLKGLVEKALKHSLEKPPGEELKTRVWQYLGQTVEKLEALMIVVLYYQLISSKKIENPAAVLTYLKTSKSLNNEGSIEEWRKKIQEEEPLLNSVVAWKVNEERKILFKGVVALVNLINLSTISMATTASD